MEAAPLKEIRQPVPLLGLLDFCKGIAIVWVMLVHAIHGWFGWQGVHVLTLAGIIAASWLFVESRSFRFVEASVQHWRRLRQGPSVTEAQPAVVSPEQIS